MNIPQIEYPKLVEAQKQINPELPDWDKTPPFIEAIKVLSQNLRETVEFIEQDCTPEQLVWMSVIALDVAANLKNKSFTDAMRKASVRFAEQIAGYNVNECIDEAEELIAEYENENQGQIPRNHQT